MIIFTSIDGVLSNKDKELNEKKIKNLSLLCKELKGIVVLTSSWRKGFNHVTKCTTEIEELKKEFRENQISLLGVTEDLGNREKEIENYIEKYNIDGYVILDSNFEFTGDKLRNIYNVDRNTGLTGKKVVEIVSKLKD